MDNVIFIVCFGGSYSGYGGIDKVFGPYKTYAEARKVYDDNYDGMDYGGVYRLDLDQPGKRVEEYSE